MKDFDFSNSAKEHQECTLSTCYPHDFGESIVKCSESHDEKNIIEIIEKLRIVDVVLLLQNQKNIKIVCEMLKRGDTRLRGVLENRPIIKHLVEHAQNEFLTDILTREIKGEN
jgi:hypothetical protein